MSQAICETCKGIGLVRTERGAAPCPSCHYAQQIGARITRAAIPAGFAGATLENFRPSPHTRAAHAAACQFVKEFIPGVSIPGLMFTGSVGTGKTHLAVGILRALVQTKGIDGRFIDVRELLDRLRSSYADGAGESHAQILRPILGADLVVIDELGAARPSDWVFETVELVIGGLYNRTTPLIVTTNLPNAAPGAQSDNAYARAARQETLADRIGMRMYSRLQQMCRPLEMIGPDWRAKR